MWHVPQGKAQAAMGVESGTAALKEGQRQGTDQGKLGKKV